MKPPAILPRNFLWQGTITNNYPTVGIVKALTFLGYLRAYFLLP